MSFIRAAIKEVVGLFVSDWVQSGVIVAIVAVGWIAVARFGAAAAILLVVLLAAQLVWFAQADGRRAKAKT
ncbi:MAG TPA: hypothetical protein VFL27_02480 [Candidatus Dormibacteraeota bacterium]|nr:hypothetical protein [Candidatus Dormibacteraeota bacterium]